MGGTPPPYMLVPPHVPPHIKCLMPAAGGQIFPIFHKIYNFFLCEMVSETLVSNSKRFCKLREHAHGACKVYTAALQHACGTRVHKNSCPPHVPPPIKFCPPPSWGGECCPPHVFRRLESPVIRHGRCFTADDQRFFKIVENKYF